MRNLCGGVAIAAMVLVLSAGCAREPRDKLAGAKLALDSARTAGADIYCEARYMRSRALMDSAAALITGQRKTLPLFRSYSRVEELLYESLRLTQETLDSLPAERDRYRQATAVHVEQARLAVEATKMAAKAAFQEGKKAEGIGGDVKDMDEMVAAAAAALENGDAVRARTLATSVIDKAAAYRQILEQLPRPVARYSSGKVRTGTATKK